MGFKTIPQLTLALTETDIKSSYQIAVSTGTQTARVYMAQLLLYISSGIGLSDYAKIDDVYLKTESYSRSETYSQDETYSQTEADALLLLKSNLATTYTMTAADALLLLKADLATTYTMTATDALLAAKSDLATTYTKTEADLLLAAKADSDSSYTATDADLLLDAKADLATTYTMTATDALLLLKADLETTYLKTETYAQAETYSQTEADALLLLKADQSTTYTKDEIDTLIPVVTGYATTEYVDGELDAKADITDIYTQAETYSQTEADDAFTTWAKIANYMYIKSETQTLTEDATTVTVELVNEFALPSFQQVIKNGSIMQSATVTMPTQDQTDETTFTASITIDGTFVTGDIVTLNVMVISVDATE